MCASLRLLSLRMPCIASIRSDVGAMATVSVGDLNESSGIWNGTGVSGSDSFRQFVPFRLLLLLLLLFFANSSIILNTLRHFVNIAS